MLGTHGPLIVPMLSDDNFATARRSALANFSDVYENFATIPLIYSGYQPITPLQTE